MPDDDEADTASEASVEAKAKAADQAAAELLAAEEAAEASAAAAKKKKKKRRGKRGGGATPMPAVDAPPAEAVAEPTVEQHGDELSDEISALLRRLGGRHERPVRSRVLLRLVLSVAAAGGERDDAPLAALAGLVEVLERAVERTCALHRASERRTVLAAAWESQQTAQG